MSDWTAAIGMEPTPLWSRPSRALTHVVLPSGLPSPPLPPFPPLGVRVRLCVRACMRAWALSDLPLSLTFQAKTLLKLFTMLAPKKNSFIECQHKGEHEAIGGQLYRNGMCLSRVSGAFG